MRSGSVSQELLHKLNNTGLQPPIRLSDLNQVVDANGMLASDAVDAVFADDIQLDFLLKQLPQKRYGLVLRNLSPQSQAFSMASGLSENLETGINKAIGRLKRDGLVTRLRQQPMNKS